MKNSNLIRMILFNILIVITIVIIFLLFFPKKSYIETKLTNDQDEVLVSNIKNIKIAAENYFENNEQKNTTLKELIDNNLINEIKDKDNNTCDVNSKIENLDEKIKISLKCNNELKEITVLKEELVCIYEYEKEIDSYSEWSEWSNWEEAKIEKDELTNVEEKIEKKEDGKTTVTEYNEISINATLNGGITCPSGYSEYEGRCKKINTSTNITASISYSCPSGYTRNGLYCYSNGNSISATKYYYCPSNSNSVEYILNGDKCTANTIIYADPIGNNTYYTCPSGYTLNNNMCITYEPYEKEVINYTDTTYYRYQKREKIKIKEIIWSNKENEKLINESYKMIKKISCDS